jgi:hypothetical protein
LQEDDPITLEPLSELPVPPFELRPLQYFDGAVLAHYLVSRGQFENPLTREGLSRKDALRLDTFLESHGEGSGNAVTDAFDLQQVVDSKVKSGDLQRNRQMRHEATLALYSLFNFRGVRRQTRAPQVPSGWRVVDADEPVGPEVKEDDEEFPSLVEGDNDVSQAFMAGPAFAEMARSAEHKVVEQRRRKEERLQQQKEERRRLEEVANKEREREREAYFCFRDEEEREKRRRRTEDIEEGRRRQEALGVAWDVAAVEDALLQKQRSAEEAAAKKKAKETEEKARVASEQVAKEQSQQEATAEEERRAAHKVKLKEKKKRQQKVKQDEKRIEREAQNKVREAEAKREEERQLKAKAQQKCGLCGEGILARKGFSCNEVLYCSTACLREGRDGSKKGFNIS